MTHPGIFLHIWPVLILLLSSAVGRAQVTNPVPDSLPIVTNAPTPAPAAIITSSPPPAPSPPAPVPKPDYSIYPQATLSNRWLTVRYYLPDAENGFYRGTRFDWSGLISRVEAAGHSYFSHFRTTHDPLNHDDVCGTAEEFDITDPPGYRQAKAGEPFLKVGVGVLERPDAEPYSFAKRHKLLKDAPWKTTAGQADVTFKHTLPLFNKWGYEYKKTIQLHTNGAVLSIIRELKNTGAETLTTEHYGHHFLKIDDAPAGPGYQLEFPFAPQLGERAETQGCLNINNRLLLFTCAVPAQKPIWTPLAGFSSPGDHRVTVRNTRTRGAVTIMGDRALEKLVFFSANGVVCPENFVKLSIPPGQTVKWTSTYVFGE